MSTEQIGATIDAALRGLRHTLESDGYGLEWSMEQENRIGIRVFAGAEACAECLVPPELMRSIVDKELSQTPYRVGSISLPAKS